VKKPKDQFHMRQGDDEPVTRVRCEYCRAYFTAVPGDLSDFLSYGIRPMCAFCATNSYNVYVLSMRSGPYGTDALGSIN